MIQLSVLYFHVMLDGAAVDSVGSSVEQFDDRQCWACCTATGRVLDVGVVCFTSRFSIVHLNVSLVILETQLHVWRHIFPG